MAERVLRGRPASPGLAIGPLVRLPRVVLRSCTPGSSAAGEQLILREEVDAAAERARLDGALARARGELEALVAATDGHGRRDPGVPAGAARRPDAGRRGARADRGRQVGVDRPGTRCCDARSCPTRMPRTNTSAPGPATSRTSRPASGVRLAAPRTGRRRCCPGRVVVDDDLTPSSFLSLDWSVLGGVALERGSPSSHVAMLARARGVPMATRSRRGAGERRGRARRRGGPAGRATRAGHPRALCAPAGRAPARRRRGIGPAHAPGRDRRPASGSR